MKKTIVRFFKENGIIASLAFIIVLVVINSIVSILERQAARKYEITTLEVATVKSGLTLINTHVNLSDMSFRGYYIIEDPQLLHPFTEQVLVEYKANYDLLYEILKRQGFDASKVPPVKEKVGEYMELINQLVSLRKQQRLDEIVEIIKTDPGYEVWKVYSKFVTEATVFENELEASVLKEYENISEIAFYVQLLLLLIGIPTLFITLFRIQKNNRVIQKLFYSIEESNKKYIFNAKEEGVESDQKMIIENLIKNLKKISSFVKGITSGDYSVAWDGLTDKNKAANQENIVGDLVNMREQMKMVKEQDERRLWVTEGISNFSEIVRSHQHDITELSNEVISNLVRYVKANQGGIFILNDSEEGKHFLELKACYAYQRKKHLEKRIEIGQGLIGQAYLEEEAIYLKEIPEDYVAITSGLGEANPRVLIVMPLMFNEKIEAVIEIASFNELEKHEIEFMQKVGEYVASAIASVKVNERTQMLLESTQEQAEQMRAQEEEMRQNMEELQATQEEVQRRTHEYQELIESNAKEIESLKSQLKKQTAGSSKG